METIENQLILKTDYEGTETMTVYDRSEWTGARLLDHLGLNRDNRYSEGFRESKYTASGLWSSYRSDAKTHMYSVDVGCHHEWDCCGCLCRLSFEIAIMSGYFVVKTDRTYNY